MNEEIKVNHYYKSRYTGDLVMVLSSGPGEVKYRPWYWQTDMFTTVENFHRTFTIHNP